MLDSLLEIEIAYSMLKVGDDSAKDPIDMHYSKLKTDIQVGLRLPSHFLHISGSIPQLSNDKLSNVTVIT